MRKAIKSKNKRGRGPEDKPRSSFPQAGSEFPFVSVVVLVVLPALVFLGAAYLSKIVTFGGTHGTFESGAIRVRDGDTILLWGEAIRLYGIDAPEAEQTCRDGIGRQWDCGEAAMRALKEKIMSSPDDVRCERKGTDRYGRRVAVCYQGAEDLNAWMVSEGHAVALRRKSTAYAGAEDRAKAARKGIWGGSFVMPDEWRRGKRG